MIGKATSSARAAERYQGRVVPGMEEAEDLGFRERETSLQADW